MMMLNYSLTVFLKGCEYSLVLYTIPLFKMLNFAQEFKIHYRCYYMNSHSKFIGTRGGQLP